MKHANPEFEPGRAVGLAAEPEVLTTGGQYGIRKIQFAGQLTAEDTVTVGGKVFTAKSAGAAGDQFNIGAALTDTLDALVTALNASAYAEVSGATYSKSGTDTLVATMDALGETAPPTLDYSGAGETVTLTAASYAAKDIAVNKRDTVISLSQAVDQFFTLADGDEGAEKRIFLKVKGGSGNAVITTQGVINNLGAPKTTITLSTVDRFVGLQFIGGIWRVFTSLNASYA